MKLSIVIPAYNAALYIDKCIQSCEKQNINRNLYEVIVVDDGSTDDTKERVSELQQKFSNIMYIYQENARQGAARNNGLRNANGKYIWYIDADDWIEENCLNEILNLIENKSLTALAVRHAKYCGSKLRLWPALVENKVISGKNILISHDYLVHPSYCIWEKDYLLSHNLFFVEHIFHEDTEIYPRLFFNANRIGFLNKVCYFLYDSKNSTTRSYNPQRAYDVITVVQHLQSFCDSILNKDVEKAVRQYICIAINMSLYNVYSLNTEDVKELNKRWFLNKYLYDNLLKCNKWKYRIEGLLFKLFPKHIVQIYKIMQWGNSDPGNMKQQSV